MDTPSHTTATPAAARSVLVVITVDGDAVLVTPSSGSPRVLSPATACAVLQQLARDPTVPEHKVTAGGFDIGDMFKGIGRALTALGADDKDGK
jgi:hypothetical protein